MFTFGVSCYRVKPRRPQKPSKNHQNSTKGFPREGRQNENCGGRGKKSEILGGPAEGRSGGGGGRSRGRAVQGDGGPGGGLGILDSGFKVQGSRFVVWVKRAARAPTSWRDPRTKT